MGSGKGYFEDVKEPHKIARKLRQVSSDLSPRNFSDEMELLEELDKELFQDLRELHGKHEDVPEVTSRIMQLSRNLEQNLEEIESQKDLSKEDVKKIRSQTKEIEKLYNRELEKQEEFVPKVRKYILEKNQELDFRIHGTDKESAESILENGLKVGSQGMNSYTKGLKTEELDEALREILTYPGGMMENYYQALVVVALNREAIKEWKEEIGDEIVYPSMEYSHVAGKLEWSEGKVPRALVLGYIDRVSKEFHLNQDFKGDKLQIQRFPRPASPD